MQISNASKILYSAHVKNLNAKRNIAYAFKKESNVANFAAALNVKIRNSNRTSLDKKSNKDGSVMLHTSHMTKTKISWNHKLMKI